jgi:hypothetical protein
MARSPDVRRTEPRLKVFQPATMTVGSGEVRVHLLDVSATGAMVHGYAEVGPDDRLALACSGWSRRAHVTWMTNKRMGVRFLQPLSARELSATLCVDSQTAGKP